MKIKIGGYYLIKKFMQFLKKPSITATIRLHRLRWFGHVQRMEETRILKRVLYMNLETKIQQIDHQIDGKMK
jgi:hypothetical protein